MEERRDLEFGCYKDEPRKIYGEDVILEDILSRERHQLLHLPEELVEEEECLKNKRRRSRRVVKLVFHELILPVDGKGNQQNKQGDSYHSKPHFFEYF